MPNVEERENYIRAHETIEDIENINRSVKKALKWPKTPPSISVGA